MSRTIYRVTNIVTKKIYIGVTVNSVKRRWQYHKSRAKKNVNNYFHNAICKYGSDAFNVETIEVVDVDRAAEREQYWINFYHSNDRNFGYNLTSGGEVGKELTEEAKEYISQRTKECMTDEVRAHISKARLGTVPWNKGIPMTEERKVHLSKVKKGIPSGRKGIKLSEEHKEKLRKPKSEEIKKKMSIAAKKRKSHQ